MPTHRYLTTATERFTSAVAALVGVEPPSAFVDEWLGGIEVNGGWRLQDWVGENLPKKLGWAQCIVILDAAQVLAESPEEGDAHEPWPEPIREAEEAELEQGPVAVPEDDFMPALKVSARAVAAALASAPSMLPTDIRTPTSLDTLLLMLSTPLKERIVEAALVAAYGTLTADDLAEGT